MNGMPRHFFEFDTYRVDVEERRLWRDGHLVDLTPKAFDILVALVQNSGQTVDKRVLMKTVWTDAFVEEGNLNHHVSTLRKILGDDRREQRFIKTIPKRGYRFTAGVQEIVESDETLSVENVSSSRLVIREEIQEGFWTIPKMVIATVLLAGIVVFGAWAITNGGSASEAKARWTSNTTATDAYTKGRKLWATRDGKDLHESIGLLERSVQIDPNFAAAHAALADAYAFDYTNWKKAEASAREAMKLDSNFGQPHASIGFVKMFWEWNLKEAESEFRQALALSPDYSTAHQWYALLLMATDRRHAAYAEMTQALELEPDSLSINADLCQTHYFLRQFDEAIVRCQETLAMDAGFYNAHRYLYEIYTAKGMYDEAVAQQIRTAEIAGITSPFAADGGLREAYNADGIRAYWKLRVEAVKRTSPYQSAKYSARMGQKDEALGWLERAYEKRDPEFLLFYTDPTFDHLRGDPRFENLIGLLFPVDDPK